jgi:ABC-type antimicrobial peptide transport system permease subunit
MQVTIVTVSGVAIAGALLAIVAATSKEDFPIEADPVLIVEIGSAVLALAIVAAAGALRRIARIDPAAATSRGGQGGLA